MMLKRQPVNSMSLPIVTLSRRLVAVPLVEAPFSHVPTIMPSLIVP